MIIDKASKHLERRLVDIALAYLASYLHHVEAWRADARRFQCSLIKRECLKRALKLKAQGMVEHDRILTGRRNEI